MTFLIFFLVLSVLVLVHEAGHFVMARILKIKVEEFALGLPFTRPIFKIRRKKGTQYSIYPLLFGGFVRLAGEDGPGDFYDRSKKYRLAVILAGVVMNMVLAISLFVVIYGIAGVPVRQVDKVTIAGVEEGTPAKLAGLLVNDRIVAVENKPLTDANELGKLMKSWAGMGVNLTIERGQGTVLFEGVFEKNIEQKTINIVPRVNPPEGQGALGIVLATYPYIETKRGTPVESAIQGFKSTGMWIGRVFEGLRQIGGSLSKGKAPEGVSGPVGIYKLTGVVAAEGILPVLELIAILSVNLGVFNVLPIPALDGGRAAFIVIEIVTKRRISAETEQKVNSIGMMVLLGLMVLISLQDVIRLGVLHF